MIFYDSFNFSIFFAASIIVSFTSLAIHNSFLYLLEDQVVPQRYSQTLSLYSCVEVCVVVAGGVVPAPVIGGNIVFHQATRRQERKRFRSKNNRNGLFKPRYDSRAGSHGSGGCCSVPPLAPKCVGVPDCIALLLWVFRERLYSPGRETR